MFDAVHVRRVLTRARRAAPRPHRGSREQPLPMPFALSHLLLLSARRRSRWLKQLAAACGKRGEHRECRCGALCRRRNVGGGPVDYVDARRESALANLGSFETSAAHSIARLLHAPLLAPRYARSLHVHSLVCVRVVSKCEALDAAAHMGSHAESRERPRHKQGSGRRTEQPGSAPPASVGGCRNGVERSVKGLRRSAGG